MVSLKSKPALLIIDMQNGFCHPSGTFAKMGLNISNHSVVIPAIQQLRSLVRKRGLPVIYTRICFKPDYSDSGLIGETVPGLKEMHGFVRGSWDAAVVIELSPDETTGEMTIDKTRNTAFWRTALEQKLEQLGVDQLIIAGVGTNVCVESTVRDAFTNGWRAVVVSDATATLTVEEHEASLQAMKWFGEIATLAEVEVALSQPKV